jgi:mono/diheme cytochrome c family protein
MLRAVLVCGMGLLAMAGCERQRNRLQQEIVPTRDQLLREGQRTYERACSSCHGLDGRGDGPVASTLRVPPTNLTLLAKRNGGVFPRDRVAAIVTGDIPLAAHGTPEMPVWRLRFGPTSSGAAATAALRTRRWLDGMVDYLESIQERA